MLRILNKANRFLVSNKSSWFNAEPHKPNFGETQNVTLIPGIGIGPEITSTTLFTQKASGKCSKQLMCPSSLTSSRISPSRTPAKDNNFTKTDAFCWE